MSFDLERARSAIAALNEKLKPIATATVDLNDPEWPEKLRQSKPLDELGIRAEAETLLLSLLDTYASGTVGERATIRELLRTNAAFAWATHVPWRSDTAEGFRLQLLSLSARWGNEDPRDLMLSLRDIYEAARAAGVSTRPIVSEVAALSEHRLADMLAAFVTKS